MGVVPLGAVPSVETIAAVSPAVAESLAAALRAGAIGATELTHDPGRVLAELAKSKGMSAPLVAAPGYLDLGALAEHDAAIVARAETAGIRGIGLSPEDMDAARAFGALIEYPTRDDRYWRRRFVADADWLADRVRLHVERAQERVRQEAERRAAKVDRERAHATAADRPPGARARRRADQAALPQPGVAPATPRPSRRVSRGGATRVDGRACA